MDKLEGFLRCFDEEDCDHLFHVSESFELPDQLEDFMRILLRHAIMIQNQRTLHLLIDNDISKHLTPRVAYTHYSFNKMICILYDRGITQYRVIPSDKPKLQRFLDCRECARKAAIAVMACFSDGRATGAFGEAAVGRNAKDVGRIIGRAIWASRGIKEWMK